jgi:alkylation response protein AidB-like acyl-CoA dehydrogenase
MASTASPSALLRGGEWLIAPSDPGGVFSPERLSEEQRMVAQTVTDFVNNEVLPSLDRLEQKDWPLARDLVKRAGALGLLGVDVPEAYGGLQLDKITSMIVSERMSRSASFGATFGAQANLMILPLTLFGSEAQKRKYLPRFLSGELIGAYCLSEPGSGSDALGARTKAVAQPDGSFVLNGEKAWITNGGFADVYIVFGKVVDGAGEHFSAFIVERAFAGVSNGKEEHKMGLHGSSTTPVILQDVRVPAENLLGEVGRGHKIAFNVLNFARFKLGAMCVGGARGAIGEAATYAGDRRQFGQPIASFGAIKHKIGEMVVRTFAVESLIYRTAGLIEGRIQATPHDEADQSVALAVLEEYAIEASIAKVAGSEMLDFVLDENIQIHGGNGFVRDYPAERHYRDSRVNRIFEGTNEINRLLIPGMLARRAVKGEPAIIQAAKALQAELSAGVGATPVSSGDASVLGTENTIVRGIKNATLMVFGLALRQYGDKLNDQQEVLMHIADMMMDAFAAESAVLRASASTAARSSHATLQVDAARVFVNDAAMRIDASARQALAAMQDGSSLSAVLGALKQLVSATPINTIALRRRLADEAVARRGYIF